MARTAVTGVAKTRAEVRRSDRSPAAGLQQAAGELAAARRSYAEAQRRLLEVITKGEAASFAEAVELVHHNDGIEPGTVQQAMWALIRGRLVSFDDRFDVHAVSPEAIA